MANASISRAAARLGAAAARAADLAVCALYPQGCRVCGAVVMRRAAGVACDACWDDPRVTQLWAGLPVCFRCGLPGAADCAEGDAACAAASLGAVRSAGAHAGALRACVLDLKRRPHVCARLARALVEAADGATAGRAEIVAPVPLHPRRRAERGFNQAELLAGLVARRAGLPLVPHALARTAAAGRLRSGLDRRARAKAVAGAFHAAPRLVAGRAVLLVDDVYTTGSTLAACAAALRDAGAAEVVALTAARAARGAGR